MLVEALLAGRGDLKLLTARNGKDGLAMARSHLPHIILMDISLPDISGGAALALLRQDPATTHIPVIALSSHAYPRQVREGLEAGFFQYLTKPYVIGDLLDAIDESLAYAAKSNHAK